MSPTDGAFGGLPPRHAALLALLDRTAALREASRRAREVTGADIGLVGVVEDGGVAVLRSWAGTRRESLHNLVVPAGLGLGGKVIATERPWRVRDYARSRGITHHFDEPIGAEGIHAMLSVPVRDENGVIGMIYVARRERAGFGDRAVTALSGVADATALALTVADLAQAQRDAEAQAERRRIAVALHDSVGAMLFTIGAQVRDLRADAGATLEFAERLGTVERQLSEASTALRRSLAALTDAPADCSLPAAVAGDCRSFQARTGITTRSLTLTDLPELDAARCRAVLTAVREALLNVEKHARASSVVVSLAEADGTLTAVVADDGVGWSGDPREASGAAGGTVRAAGGMGLTAVEERVARLGGSLQVVAHDDAGLTVRIRIPCP
ncbi:GAF domain-containing sensor histidine kinase [Streptomyces sp. NTH33]|uniref:GAF domain-containing sensor histidine kinase n=1 Tax=Streptomyces sp. NTH33 TaxID=1735453 RepID=UPI0015E8D24C|nr:GAF domain-containing protein [Streptomyces sp. NTH33]